MLIQKYSQNLICDVDVAVIFMNRIHPQLLCQMVASHLNSVTTNTHIARKEIWFMAHTLEQFFAAYECPMQTPTGTPINKRLFYIAAKTPNWENAVQWLKRDKRIFCLTDNRSVRVTFWVAVLNYQLNKWIKG
jgi:hypothetical protein